MPAMPPHIFSVGAAPPPLGAPAPPAALVPPLAGGGAAVGAGAAGSCGGGVAGEQAKRNVSETNAGSFRMRPHRSGASRRRAWRYIRAPMLRRLLVSVALSALGCASAAPPSPAGAPT